MGESFDTLAYAHEHFSEVAWMGQNTNHLFPRAVPRRAVTRAMREGRYEEYPYAPGMMELKNLIREDLGLPGAKVGITAGGTEALYMITRGLLGPGDEVVASDPSYLIIHKFIGLSGAKTIDNEIYGAPWRLTSERVNESITPKTRMILLIDPLNPLGSAYPEAEVRAIAEIAHDRKLLLLNDVTYRDFSEQNALAARWAPDETITVWSLSKNCGLAGMRIGGFLAPEELFGRIWRYNTNDLGVNVLSQWAAIETMKAKPLVFPRIKHQSRKNQESIRSAVEQIPGAFLPVFPSQGNMFVIDISRLGIEPEKLQRELLEKHKVFVRAGNYLSPGFGSRFFRVSFSNSKDDIGRFVTALPLAIQAVKGG